MSASQVYASYCIQDSPISSTPSSLLLNSDGQFIVLAKTTAHLFTPGTGIEVEGAALQQSETKADLAKGTQKGGKRNEMQMFSTSILVEKKAIIEWHEYSNDFRTVAAGRMDSYWRSASWSPSGISTLGGCVLATLTNNAEVLLFEPPKNAHRGQWDETCDLTTDLVHRLERDAGLNRSMLVLQAQATRISWSYPIPSIFGDWSILAVGHKSGHVSLWRYMEDKTVQLLRRHRVTETVAWIASIAWSPWKVSSKSGSHLASSYLSIADSDGSIWAIEITQDCTNASKLRQWKANQAGQEGAGGDGMRMDMDMEGDGGIRISAPVLLGKKDGRSVTQAKWIEQDSKVVLVYTKLGTVNIASFARPKETTVKALKPERETELELETMGAERWDGANPIAVCAGLDYFSQSKLVVATLSSGAFYSISLVPIPSFVKEGTDLPSSADLTATARRCFAKSAKQMDSDRQARVDDGRVPLNRHVGMEIKGASAFNDDGGMGWVYQSDVPDSLTYFPTVKTIFMLAPLFQTATDTSLLSLLSSPPNPIFHPSSRFLGPFLFSAQARLEDSEFVKDILELISAPVRRSARPKVTVIKDLDAFMLAFKREIVDDRLLGALRLKETIARFFVRNRSLPEEYIDDALLIHATLARRISCEVLGRLGSILHASGSVLPPEEKPFSARMTTAYASLQDDPKKGDDDRIAQPEAFGASTAVDPCPACSADVPFDDSRRAKCANERCSITLALIATVKVRTCINCERKALESLPPVEDDLYEDHLHIVAAVLKAATFCLYCGGRWFKLL